MERFFRKKQQKSILVVLSFLSLNALGVYDNSSSIDVTTFPFEFGLSGNPYPTLFISVLIFRSRNDYNSNSTYARRWKIRLVHTSSNL